MKRVSLYNNLLLSRTDVILDYYTLREFHEYTDKSSDQKSTGKNTG